MTESKAPSERERLLLIALLVVYLVLLTWIVLWKLEVPWIGQAAAYQRPIKLVPFLPSGDAGGSNPIEVVGNILLFDPFGLYLGLLARAWQWGRIAALFAAASLALEITQHILATGSFDIGDVISNTFGGLLGLGLLTLARRRFEERAAKIMTRILLIGTAVSIVAVAIFVASPLRYESPRDVIVDRSGVSDAP